MTDLMSVESAAQAAYIVAALLFILALAGLSHHESARLGNTFGMAGMTVALVATIALAIDRDISGAGLALLVVAMLAGAAIGLWRARVVEMTGMPELIALLQIGHDAAAITALATAAILLASINVFGGFAVTRRMLAMFSRS